MTRRSDWPVWPLEDVAKIASGITLGRKTNETDLIATPYLRVANVQDGYLDLREIKTVEITAGELERWTLEPGDLLLTEGGDPDKLGRGCVWRSQLPICIHQNHIFRVRLPMHRYDLDFVSAQFGSPYGKSYFLARAKQTTGIATINRQVLGAFPLLSPPMAEQLRIAKHLKGQLAAVDEARTAAQSQKRDALALSAAILQSAFRGVTPVSANRDMVEPNRGWHWHLIKDLARLESGHTPSRYRPDWWGGDTSWISLTEIRALDGGWTEETRIKTNPAGIANSSARILPRGTVCFSRTASVGFVTIMAKPMATSQDFANWVCGDELDPEFLMYALLCSRDHLRSQATGATHKTIYMPALGQLQICAPPRMEQEAIVCRLKSQLAVAAEASVAVEKQLSEIKRLPGRILATAFGDAEEPQGRAAASGYASLTRPTDLA